MTPLAFQNDPVGTYLALAAELRSHEYPFDLDEGSFAPSFEPIEEEEKERIRMRPAVPPPQNPTAPYLRRPFGPAIRKLPSEHCPAPPKSPLPHLK
jgi:hypothetical protein